MFARLAGIADVGGFSAFIYRCGDGVTFRFHKDQLVFVVQVFP